MGKPEIIVDKMRPCAEVDCPIIQGQDGTREFGIVEGGMSPEEDRLLPLRPIWTRLLMLGHLVSRARR